MEAEIKILGFAGSLRSGSYNRALLRAAGDLLPAGARLDLFDLRDIPVFNQDTEGDMPAAVREFKAGIAVADGLLIATPEYNYSIPGVLKNALDWASRPSGDNSWAGKPVAVMGASNGMFGTARAQYHLRQVFVSLNMHTLNRPEVMVTFAEKKFDSQGRLTDQPTLDKIRDLLEALVELARKYRKG
jgi:chromate reductase